ncbi:MAG: ABC transporter permease [Verrucomicrobia bacterium]|nr:ABC transporter permease [Verrucomicrobiota bacterium]
MESVSPFLRVLLRYSVIVPLLRGLFGQRIWAVSALTWKAAFRFRLFWVLSGLLLCSVVLLPMLLKDDGTSRGFIQIMLTYTLSVITALLGFSTLWLACGTLARDIEDCSMQMVAVKPIARWQIWLGKWLGILLLNASLLAVSGGAVYGLLHWRMTKMENAVVAAKERKDDRLAAFIDSQLNILRNEIFVARAGLKEPPPDIEKEVAYQVTKMPNRDSLPPDQLAEATAQLRGKGEGVSAGGRARPSPGVDDRFRFEASLDRRWAIVPAR